MSNDKQSSVEWLAEIIRFANKELYAEMFEAIEQAKEMEVAGRQMSYDEGYKEGYKRALELIEWKIQQVKDK
jgi:hypothetical protein